MKRVWGRTYDAQGNASWVSVETDANGFDDNVYLTALAQYLKLNLGESPFYADDGIPQQQTLVTQVWPDYYVMRAQQRFAQFFASLVITPRRNVSAPTYRIQAVTHNGATLNAEVAV